MGAEVQKRYEGAWGLCMSSCVAQWRDSNKSLKIMFLAMGDKGDSCQKASIIQSLLSFSLDV